MAALVFSSAQRAHSKLQKAALRAGLTAGGCPPRLNEHRRERSAAAMPPCSSEPPEAAPPPGQRSGGFCQLVRAVRRPRLYGACVQFWRERGALSTLKQQT